MILLSVTGVLLTLFRIVIGISEGSLALVLLGIWSGFILIEVFGLIDPFLSQVTILPVKSPPPVSEIQKPASSPERSVNIVRLVLLFLVATILPGIGMSSIKSFFQIYMGVKSGFTGLISLMTIMGSVILWEGCFLPFLANRRRRALKGRLQILLGLMVFSISGAAYFFGGMFRLVEPAGNLFLCMILFIRVLGELLIRIPQLFPGENRDLVSVE
ncbi:MAG: hypothetical protein JEY99_08005 [Spirochaetales bacterium]|nr:hypothetical protein [Spirochaetales bacterium]